MQNRGDGGIDPKKRRKKLAAILREYGYDPDEILPPDKHDTLIALLLAGLTGLVAAEILDKVVEAAAPPEEEITEYWVLGEGGKSGENCPICIGFNAMGGQPLGYFPEQRTHTTYCEEYCSCHMEYSDGQDHTDIERYTDWQDWEMNRGFAM